MHNCYYEKIGKSDSVKLEDLPFDIPDNWTWVRLKNTSILNGGYAFKSEKFSSNGVRVIRISDFDENGIKNKDIKRYPYSNELDQYEIAFNDILLCMTGGTVGKSVLVQKLDEPSYINQRVALIRIHSIEVCYFYSVLISSYISQVINSSKTSTNDNISMKLIEDFLIPLPPLEEQQRIVEKITSFEPLLQEYESYEKKLTELEAGFTDKLKKSILQYAIEGKLVKQDPNDEPASVLLERIKTEKERLIKEGKIKRDKNESYIYQGDDKNYYEKVIKTSKEIDISNHTFAIPNSWIWCSLSQISEQITDGTHKTPNYQQSGIPFLSIANISSGKYDNKPKYISPDEHLQLIKRCNPEIDDILLCRIGTLGKPFINRLNFEYSIFVSLALIKPINRKLSEYVKIVLDSPNTYSFIDLIKVGGGTHTFKINIEDLNTFPIPLPPLKEQYRIVNSINTIFEKIDNLIS